MKNSIKWMMLVTVALVCSSAWAALFDPNNDPNLAFNLDFEDNTDATHTVDAKSSLIGTVIDYNTAGPGLWQTTDGIRGTYADFNQPNDADEGVGDYNDCGISVTPNGALFEFGDGWPGNENTTISFWFNMPNPDSGSFMRHEYLYDPDPENITYYWEIQAVSGKLQFRHGLNCIRFETADSLTSLGVKSNTWHHAVVVIDRSNCVRSSVPSTSHSSKMYIDGVEAPIIITYLNSTNMNLDTYPYYESPLLVGTGARNFDGLLDEVRIYNRILSLLDISLLYQHNPGVPHVTAIRPVPSSLNVPINTGISWEPYPGASSEQLYFGTDPESLSAITSDPNKATNLQLVTALGHSLELGVTYYWYVKSTVGGSDIDSPVWSFTVETGMASNPVPANGAEDIDVTDVNIYWTGSATALSYDVYYATDRSLVEALDASVKIKTAITAQQVNDVNSKLRSQEYYWCVVSNYSGDSVAGPVWSFTTRPYELVFNTRRNHVTNYQGYAVPALTCSLHSDGWTDVVTGTLDTDANLAVFNFPSGFNYDRRYDITVVPIYRAQDINSTINIRPVSIRVTGDFYFDGKIRIAGENITASTYDTPMSCSGGYPGPRHNSGTTTNLPDSLCWTDSASIPSGYHTRFGTMSSKTFWMADANARNCFGPGVARAISPYKTGGGGGSGGAGGNCGRGYMHGLDCTGPSYGDKEIPIPMGGSAGGWGSVAAGCPGGGAIEIIATGNVTFDSNSEIRAYGGNALYGPVGSSSGTGSGGGGGQVKIIAGGNFINKGYINVNGGQGGHSSEKGNNVGGGGGGGRVAIFYGGTYTNTGFITADGGLKGLYSGGSGTLSLGEDGQDGSIYIVNNGSVNSKKASAPTPVNGDKQFYVSGSTMPLKWHSGFNASTDEVYWGTNPASLAKVGATVTATRGQHTSTANVTVTPGKTYYFKVVTDGTINSDLWSYQVVNWQCPLNAIANNHISGPEWDINGDCVINDEDFWYFAKDWRIPRVAGDDYTLQPGDDLWRYVNEWLLCVNRTNGGCTDWE